MSVVLKMKFGELIGSECILISTPLHLVIPTGKQECMNNRESMISLIASFMSKKKSLFKQDITLSDSITR